MSIQNPDVYSKKIAEKFSEFYPQKFSPVPIQSISAFIYFISYCVYYFN